MITTCIPTSAKLGFLTGVFLPGHSYYIALYFDQGALNLGPTTLAYQATGEVANGSGYTTGGQLLTGYASGSDTNGAWITFTNPVWSGATFTANGFIIYDASVAGNPVVCVVSMGANQTVSAGSFTVQMPTPATGLSAIIHLD